ncbi:MAG: phosphatidate cytidylyltransferase [Hyphomicrobiales bacterium]|nr:MAG: phosphatidate cytidylyltransferase [Hyphomicrobiales bacterium]
MKIGLICGGGRLPKDTAHALLAKNTEFTVIRLAGEADTDLEISANIGSETIGWGQVGRFFDILKAENCTHVLAAGGVTKRPDFTAIKMDFGGLKMIPEILRSVLGGDDQVLSNVAQMFEKRGFTVIGVLDAAPDLSCPQGLLVGSTPNDDTSTDIKLACKAAISAGILDMGQGAVAAHGRVIAMEGPEGTQNMLGRVADIKNTKRARWKKGQGVLVKLPKPNQDMRFDVPVIGPDTVTQAKQAGLAGIAVAAGQVLLLDKALLLETAARENIFIQGISAVEMGA